MIIHLIAPKDQTKWPEIWHKCYNIWKTSPYEIKMWHDEDVDNLLKEDDEEFFNIINTLDPIYKWDYVRYIILGRFGGAYFDMDVEIIDGTFLPKLDPHRIYIAEGEGNCLVSNFIMISPPDMEFWYTIKKHSQHRLLQNLDKCKESEFWTLETVGPISLSYILSQGQYRYTPLSRHHFDHIHSSLRYAVHHFTHSWTENKSSPFPYYHNFH
jgi:mannosyltransferase OCH1-like enzyme